MKTEFTFTFTLTLRPLKWLRNVALAGVVALMAFAPMNRLSPKAGDVPRSVGQLSFDNAVSVVENVLADRSKMSAVERRYLANVIVRESIKADFDPLFILAVIEVESNYDHRARSIRCREPGNEATCYLNASGLMQVIPKTWASEIRRRGLGKMDSLNARDNVVVGVGYLAHIGKGFKRTSSLLWAYNQGPGVASGKLPVDWTEERVEKAKAEGANFENRVTTTYLRLLQKYCGIKPNYKRLQQLYRAPSLTIYAPATQGDLYGPPEMP